MRSRKFLPLVVCAAAAAAAITSSCARSAAVADGSIQVLSPADDSFAYETPTSSDMPGHLDDVSPPSGSGVQREEACSSLSFTELVDQAKASGLSWFIGSVELTGGILEQGSPEDTSDWALLTEMQVTVERVLLGPDLPKSFVGFVWGGATESRVFGYQNPETQSWSASGEVFGIVGTYDTARGPLLGLRPVTPEGVAFLEVGCAEVTDLPADRIDQIQFMQIQDGSVVQTSASARIVELPVLEELLA